MKKKKSTYFRKKKYKKNKAALLMIHADGKGTAFPVKLELYKESLE